MVYFITNNYIPPTPFRVLFRYHEDSRREETEGKKTDLHLTLIFLVVCIYFRFVCILSFLFVCFVPPLGLLSCRCYLVETLPGQIASGLYIRSAKALQRIRGKALMSVTIYLYFLFIESILLWVNISSLFFFYFCKNNLTQELQIKYFFLD